MNEYPATRTVHWPTGPVDCCEAHANKLVNMGHMLGSHIGVTESSEGAQCSNCINESKSQ